MLNIPYFFGDCPSKFEERMAFSPISSFADGTGGGFQERSHFQGGNWKLGHRRHVMGRGVPH
jgi:hypothetical protein